jgi:predicted ester cyclase
MRAEGAPGLIGKLTVMSYRKELAKKRLTKMMSLSRNHARTARGKLILTRPFFAVSTLQRDSAIAVNKIDLPDVYRAYIACLNKQDWPKLEQFVHDDVYYNGQRIGLSGYREMLERDFREIPDLYFNIQLLISDPPYVAGRLGFACTPKGTFLGLHVNGKRVSFAENVFYQFRKNKIEQVWSVIDKAAIEVQL